jgi:stress response protein SCP2
MTDVLAKGANAPLAGASCEIRVGAPGAPVDVSAVLLGADGRVRADSDLVFYNHPAQDGVSLAGPVVSADLARVPAGVDRIAVVASIDVDRPEARFDGPGALRAAVDCAGRRLEFAAPPMDGGETVVVLVELYRRGGGWKVRAVGQGWASGLAGLAADFGVVVDDPGTPAAAPPPQQQEPNGAISLEKVRQRAPGLVDLYKHAAVSLGKAGLLGRRAAVYLVLDHSGSMRRYYKQGTVQRLAEQVLGLSANLDDDGVVPVVFFSGKVDAVVEIGLDDYQGRINEVHAGLRMGGTDYVPAMEAVVEHYQRSGGKDPAFVVFQTDGAPADKSRTRKLLQRTSRLPLFWQFVGFGPSGNLGFLQKLDDLPGRAVDNAGFFWAGQDPDRWSDSDLYDQLMREFPGWLTAAAAARIL